MTKFSSGTISIQTPPEAFFATLSPALKRAQFLLLNSDIQQDRYSSDGNWTVGSLGTGAFGLIWCGCCSCPRIGRLLLNSKSIDFVANVKLPVKNFCFFLEGNNGMFLEHIQMTRIKWFTSKRNIYVTLWLFSIAHGSHGPFIDGLPINSMVIFQFANCKITRWYRWFLNPQILLNIQYMR